MDKFKIIEIAPLTRLNDIKLNVAEQKGWNFGSLSEPQIAQLLSLALPETRKIKGALLFTGNGDDMFLNASLRTSKNKKVHYTFPEINPITVYYRSAVEHAIAAVNIRITLKSEEMAMSKSTFLEFANFYNEASQAVILLCTTIEGFINQLIPEDVSIDLGNGLKTKSELEFLDLNRKLKNLLPELYEINFFETHLTEFNQISLMIALRHDLIHLKTNIGENGTAYQNIFKRLIDFEYQKAAASVFTFVDTFKTGYFVEVQGEREEPK